MSSALRRHASSGLRLLAMLVLVIGLVAKPVLVAACELEDLSLAAVTHQAVADAVADPAGDACCPAQACGECCTTGTVLPMTIAASAAMPAAGRPQVATPVEADPAPLDASIRPPIAG